MSLILHSRSTELIDFLAAVGSANRRLEPRSMHAFSLKANVIKGQM